MLEVADHVAELFMASLEGYFKVQVVVIFNLLRAGGRKQYAPV